MATTNDTDTKNIVIIGASSAGSQLVNDLVPTLPLTHRILLIEALDFAFWPIASLRAAVVPRWETRATASIDQETFFTAGSHHRLIAPNAAVELKESSVVLEHPFEGSTEVPFDKCILALGALQPPPMRPTPGSTEEEYRASLVKLQGEFKAAKKIVIIGAGAVGLELSGEIRENYPDTSITLVHALPHVLNPMATQSISGAFSYSSPPTAPKLSKEIERQLNGKNIDLITNDRVTIPTDSATGPDASGVNDAWDGSMGLQNGLKNVTLDSGKVLQADFVFIGQGNKPNVELAEKLDPGAIASGLIAVDEYLKVTSKTVNSPLATNYYAIGDCCSTPGWKTCQGAQSDADACAVNVVAEAKKRTAKAYTRPKPYVMFIPLGTKAGAGTLTLPLLGATMVPQFMVKSGKGEKLLVEELFFARFKGEKKLKAPPIPGTA